MEPLVAPGPPLTTAQAETYARHLLLPEIGELGQRRLLNARVLVVGAGGLGSPALLYLAAAGVGTLGVIDDDVVETSNLQRQVLHGVADVGRSKLASAAERLAAVAPDLVLRTHPERLTPANAAALLAGYDLVLDGTDTFETRYAVADACAALGVPLVWGSVLGFDAQVSVFWPQAPGGGPTLRDLFPDPPPPGSVPSCAEAGVLGSLTGQVGSVMATEALKLLTGAGQPLLGRVLVLDGLRQRWSEVPLRPRAGAPAETPVAPVATAAPALPPTEDLTLDVDELRARLAAGESLRVVDVREPFEVAAGSIPGAEHLPLGRLLADVTALAGERPVVAVCQVGARSERAATALRAAGIPAWSLRGGYPAWAAAAEVAR